MLKKIFFILITIFAQSGAFAAIDQPLFLRGDMNNWDAKPAYKLVEVSNNTWMAKAELKSKKSIKFKFADKGWKSNTTIGIAKAQPEITLDQKISAGIGYQWADFKFIPAKDGTYYFYLVLTDLKKPYVIIKNKAM